LEGVRRLRERPITDRERHTAMSAVAAALTAATILLTAIRPAAQPHHQTPRPAAPTASASRPTTLNSVAPVAAVTARVAQELLTGYLAYLYGHAPAADIHGAAPALARSLRVHPPLVSPAIRARDPRVLSLRPAPAPAGRAGVSALVNDGELASYPLVLLLARENGVLLVSAVEGA
jgi:hypothetical protein